MGEQVQLSGTISGAPASGSENQFPSSVLNIGFALNPPSKAFNVAAGGLPMTINSPASYIALPGIGAVPGLTEAALLYARTTVAMKFRLTYKGDATPHVSYVNGLFVVEADPSSPIVLFEVMGSGTLEFYATGLV